MSVFSDFPIHAKVVKGVAASHFVRPTSVQSKCIPVVLQQRDVLLHAPSECGKTVAYLVPLVHLVLNAVESVDEPEGIRAVVVAPTHEVCQTVFTTLQSLCRFARKTVRCNHISSKVPPGHEKALLKGDMPHVLVGTPLKLAELLVAGSIALGDALKLLVVDDADLAVAYGYTSNIKKIASFLPKHRQSVMVTATRGTSEMRSLERALLWKDREIVEHDIDSQSNSGTMLTQASQVVFQCSDKDKYLVVYTLLKLGIIKGKTLFFMTSIDRCYRLKLFLERFAISSAVLNHELPYNTRLAVLKQFNHGVFDYIIATDESAHFDRGLVKREDGDDTSDESDSDGDLDLDNFGDENDSDFADDMAKPPKKKAKMGGDENVDLNGGGMEDTVDLEIEEGSGKDSASDSDSEGSSDSEAGDDAEAKTAETKSAVTSSTSQSSDSDNSDSDSDDADDEDDGELDADADIVSSIQKSISSKKRKRAADIDEEAHAPLAAPGSTDAEDGEEREHSEKTSDSDSDSSDSDSSSSSSDSDDAGQSKSKRPRVSEDASAAVAGRAPRRKVVFRDLNTVVNFDFPTALAGHKERENIALSSPTTSGVVLSLVAPNEASYVDEFIALLREESSNPLTFASPFKPLNVSFDDINAFRYRVEDKLRTVTRESVRRARLLEIKDEMMQSKKLRDYFKDNPRELRLLKRLRKAKREAPQDVGLDHIPSYLLPKGYSAAVSTSQNFQTGMYKSRGRGGRGARRGVRFNRGGRGRGRGRGNRGRKRKHRSRKR